MFYFGQYKGKTLNRIAKIDPDYLRWILNSDFPLNFKTKIRKALGVPEPILTEASNKTQKLIQDFIMGKISSKKLLQLILD